jgi:hypothetical protein
MTCTYSIKISQWEKREAVRLIPFQNLLIRTKLGDFE